MEEQWTIDDRYNLHNLQQLRDHRIQVNREMLLDDYFRPEEFEKDENKSQLNIEESDRYVDLREEEHVQSIMVHKSDKSK